MKSFKYYFFTIFVILTILGSVYGAYYFLYPEKIYYVDFGIAVPRDYKVHGIDVSRHQGKINWEQVANMKVDKITIDFAFIKATEGKNFIDFRYFINWRKAKQYNIIRGAYHYFKPLTNAESQAKSFINTVDLKNGDLPPVLDVEENGGLSDAELINRIRKWLNKVENHYGLKPIIYVNIEYYNKYIKGNFDNYPIWIAHYYQRKPRMVNNKWKLWQHSDKGHIDGISENVDFNVFNGSLLDLKNMCK